MKTLDGWLNPEDIEEAKKVVLYKKTVSKCIRLLGQRKITNVDDGVTVPTIALFGFFGRHIRMDILFYSIYVRLFFKNYCFLGLFMEL